MPTTIAILNRDNRSLLDHVAPGVFDHEIQPDLLEEFLNDPRHHMVIAVDGELTVGMASGVHYVHPDKPAQLFINEVAVAPPHQNQGIGRQLLKALLDVGRQLQCTEAWVLTDRSNPPGMRLYASSRGKELARDQVMFTFDLP
jgi:ribosomal protein S18 acetylase RimI-like enzyme